MKKIILAFLLIFALFTLNFTKVSASEVEYATLKETTTKSGDSLKVNKVVGEYKFVLVLNDSIAVDLKTEGKNFGFCSIYESTNYYCIYGSLKEGSNYKEVKPFFYVIGKGLDTTSEIYYYDGINDKNSEFGDLAFVCDLIEYEVDCFALTMLVDGEFNTKIAFTYSGRYKLYSVTKDKIVSVDIDPTQDLPSLSIAYNLIDVSDMYDNHYYFDKDLSLKKTYDKEETTTGAFVILTDTTVNGTLYSKGTGFSTPGIYELDDGVHEKKTITLDAIVSGVDDGKVYTSYVDFKVSGGDVYLNDEPSYLNGTVSKTGVYSIKVVGVNGYLKVVSFSIAPTLITTVSDGGTLNIGDTIEFTGEAKLNNTVISSGYRLDEAGVYSLSLILGDKTYETITFTVPEVEVTVRAKTGLYITLSIIGVLLIATCVFVTVKSLNSKKRRH